MRKKRKKERIEYISGMLLELASGNFHLRLERSLKKDYIEALAAIVNMLAEEIEASFIHQAYTNSPESIKHLVQLSFVLNDKRVIEYASPNIYALLGHTREDIIGRPLSRIISEDSKEKWEKMKFALNPELFHLTFITKDKLTAPSKCACHYYPDGNGTNKIHLSTFYPSKNQKEIKSKLRKKVSAYLENQTSSSGIETIRKRLSPEDVQKMRDAHQYILENLEQEIPSLKAFAIQLGTNEFKLKYGFKQMYGITVFRFVTQERLRKACFLIENTEIPLKTIAYKTGFKSFPHFSKAFKKQYDFAPSALRKQALENNK